MPITNQALADKIDALITSWQDIQDELQDWLAGVVGGGPNSDGKYPITDSLGNVRLTESPAQLEDDVTNVVNSATTQATAAASSATAAAASATDAATSATQAADDRAGAEAAETAAEAAQADAYSSRSVAIAQAVLATTKATAAAASAAAAATSETNAAASATSAAADVTYAAEWANKAHNSLVSIAAGGDNVDDYSALHWATEAATFNPALYALLTGATFSGNVTAPTFTGDGSLLTNVALLNVKDIFTASGSSYSNWAIEIQSVVPVFGLKETGAGTDQKVWYDYVSSGVRHLGIANDAVNTLTDYMTVTRGSGGLSGVQFTTSGGIGTYSLLANAALPMISWNETGAAANNRMWRMYATSEHWQFATSNDAQTAGVAIMSVERTNNTVDSIDFTASLITASATIELGGQTRAKGWYTTGTGAAAESGISAGVAYYVGYDRTGSNYVDTNLVGANVYVNAQGGSSVNLQIAATTYAQATTAGLNIVNGGKLYLLSHEAITDSNDGYLRFNNASTYGNGIYTPLMVRMDQGLNVAGSYYFNSVPNGGMTYGSFYVQGASTGFAGIAVYDGGYITPTLMSQGSGGVAGIYMQSDAKWMMYALDGGSILLTGYSTIQDAGSGGAYPRYNSTAYPSSIITVSSSAPSGGSNGDIWFKV